LSRLQLLSAAADEAAVHSSIRSSTCFSRLQSSGPEKDLQNGDVESTRGCSDSSLVSDQNPVTETFTGLLQPGYS